MDEQQPGGADADIRLVDAEGYQAQPRDLAFAGVDDAAIRSMQRQETPLGFASRAQWLHCLAELHAALAEDGLWDADVRIRGSATTFFSANPNKRFPQSADEYGAQASAVGMPREEAQARWERSPFAGAGALPNRHFFDSRFRLGLDIEPSDFDFQLASGMLAQRLEARFPGARDGDGKVIISAHGGHYKDAYVRQVCPALDTWTRTWSAVTNRTLTLAGFGAEGPLGPSRYADTDWVVAAPQTPPKE